jgi:Flp pilus assembly protein TadG
MATRERRIQLGQSLIELAISVPVLIWLLLGSFDAGVMISDKVIAGAACRQGARLAAEIGGQLTNPGMATSTADADVVKNVLAVAQAMNYSTITNIYIYKPTQPDGDYHAGDPVDHFNGSGTNIGGYGFPLTARSQVPPNETPIGVRIEWTYNPPTGLATFSIGLSEHTTFLASPVLP